mmetsp:Transcript_84086/g.136308  ORF Transcript_84086/g.136308 Transcript_84086/m.136308 type:complete len:245 (+) Transcript_84086:440-1174(+)
MHCICVSSALSGSVHRSTKATRVHSTHGVLNLLLAPFTVARRRIDHKGFTSFHRYRPPILIVSGSPGSTTLFGHARVQKPSMRVGCAVCVLQPLTAEHGPAPVTALLHAITFPNCCVDSCSRAGSTGARHHLQHPHEKNQCCDEPQNMPNGKNLWSSTRHGSQGSRCHSEGRARDDENGLQQACGTYVGRERRVACPAHHGDDNHSHNCLAKHSTVEITLQQPAGQHEECTHSQQCQQECRTGP